jgi:hypothetical protein
MQVLLYLIPTHALCIVKDGLDIGSFGSSGRAGGWRWALVLHRTLRRTLGRQRRATRRTRGSLSVVILIRPLESRLLLLLLLLDWLLLLLVVVGWTRRAVLMRLLLLMLLLLALLMMRRPLLLEILFVGARTIGTTTVVIVVLIVVVVVVVVMVMVVVVVGLMRTSVLMVLIVVIKPLVTVKPLIVVKPLVVIEVVSGTLLVVIGLPATTIRLFTTVRSLVLHATYRNIDEYNMQVR